MYALIQLPTLLCKIAKEICCMSSRIGEFFYTIFQLRMFVHSITIQYALINLVPFCTFFMYSYYWWLVYTLKYLLIWCTRVFTLSNQQLFNALLQLTSLVCFNAIGDFLVTCRFDNIYINTFVTDNFFMNSWKWKYFCCTITLDNSIIKVVSYMRYCNWQLFMHYCNWLLL